MTYKEYMEKRNALLEEATELGDVEEIKAKTQEVKDLDEKYQKIATAQADINALREQKVVNLLQNPASVNSVNETPENITNSVDYRTKFMNFVLNKSPMMNEDANTKTTDVASVIPDVVVNRIIEKIEATGMILPLITRTAFKSGVKIPTSSVRPVATWVSEGASSDRQKKTTSFIVFTHHKLRCEISMSMEVGTMALSVFEDTFVKQVAEAMVKAIETKIVSDADGTTSMKGILAETPATGQALTVSDISYETLVKAEAALPEQYEGGAVWCMSKKTFMQFIGMTDANGQPIARINYGVNGKPERTLLGRTVKTCGSYLSSYTSTLASGTIFAFIFNFADYAMNTVYDMGIQKKQDWDTEDLLTKAVMAVDGKVTDKNSLVTLEVE